MNWQYVTLTLGVTLITSMLSIVGTIIINKHNQKLALERNKEEIVKNVMNKRIDCYKQLLLCLLFIETHSSEQDAIEKSNVKSCMIENEIYISKAVYASLCRLIAEFDSKKPKETKYNTLNLKGVMKNEINAYLGIPNSKHDKKYPKKK